MGFRMRRHSRKTTWACIGDGEEPAKGQEALELVQTDFLCPWRSLPLRVAQPMATLTPR